MKIPKKINKVSARRLVKESQLGPEKKKNLLHLINQFKGGDTANVSDVLSSHFQANKNRENSESFKQKKMLDTQKMDKA